MRFLWLLPVFSLALSAEPTLIEQRIAASRQAISKNPTDSAAYNELALALVRRARETADAGQCALAEAPVEQSLKLAPGKFEGRRARVAVRLCEMRWEEALEEATALHKQVMDDVVTWGYIADAQTALGNYEAAALAVQWMINMRQASPQALQRGAKLREAYGMNEPAMEWWTSALHLTSATDVEERAWLLTRMARLNRMLGKSDAAGESVKQSLALVPDYPWALDELGQNLMAAKKYTEAVAAFQRRQKLAPSVSGLYELGLALRAAGETDLASATLTEFEKQATAMVQAPDNANLALIGYYAGEGRRPADAVRLAQARLVSRHDLETMAACAQALAAQGDWKGAAGEMAQALKTGAKNPAWLVEAGRMARKTGDESGARKYFQQALEAAPASAVSEQAIQELSKPPA